MEKNSADSPLDQAIEQYKRDLMAVYRRSRTLERPAGRSSEQQPTPSAPAQPPEDPRAPTHDPDLSGQEPEKLLMRRFPNQRTLTSRRKTPAHPKMPSAAMRQNTWPPLGNSSVSYWISANRNTPLRRTPPNRKHPPQLCGRSPASRRKTPVHPKMPLAVMRQNTWPPPGNSSVSCWISANRDAPLRRTPPNRKHPPQLCGRSSASRRKTPVRQEMPSAAMRQNTWPPPGNSSVSCWISANRNTPLRRTPPNRRRPPQLCGRSPASRRKTPAHPKMPLAVMRQNTWPPPGNSFVSCWIRTANRPRPLATPIIPQMTKTSNHLRR